MDYDIDGGYLIKIINGKEKRIILFQRYSIFL